MKKLTFKQLCPDWHEKFKKKNLNLDCVQEMNSHLACAVGEAYSLRNKYSILNAHDASNNEYTHVLSYKKYYNVDFRGWCRICNDFSHDFNSLYRPTQYYVLIMNLKIGRVVKRTYKNKEMKDLQNRLVEHFIERHQNILKERGLPTQ